MENNLVNPMIPPPDATPRAALTSLWQWIRRSVQVRRGRRLRVCESLSLGERRFLAVIEFDGQELLVGGSGNSLELLARLQDGKVIPENSPARPPQIWLTQ